MTDAQGRAIRRLDGLDDLDLLEPPVLAHGNDLRGDHPALPLSAAACRDALAAVDRAETRHVDGAGIAPLRAAVARRLNRMGIDVDPERGLLITGGEQEARFLAIKGLAMAGRRLVLPAVVHPGVRKAAALAGIERSTVPFDPGDAAPHLDGIRRAIRGTLAAIYLESPNRLSGRLIPAPALATIQTVAAETGALVVCDIGLAGWVESAGPSYPLGPSVANGAGTAWIGTVWAGAGVEGWLIAFLALPPASYAEPRRLKQVMALCTSVPVQWGTLGLLADGDDEVSQHIGRLAQIRSRALEEWPSVLAGDAVTIVAARIPRGLDPSQLEGGMPGSAFGAEDIMRFTVTPEARVVDALGRLARQARVQRGER